MKRIVSLVIAGLLCSASVLIAQESAENELELVRQLRLKGWNDLARLKLDELAKSTDPRIIAALPLESARINISMARQLDPEQRFALFAAARTQLQDFIQKNQGKVEAALASAELARLTSYHAQALLTKAMREDDNKARHERARPAETMFMQAGKDLGAAEVALKQAIPNATGKLKNTLDQEARQIRFDKATNLFNQARTYIDKSKDVVNAQRSDVMTKAQKAFKELSTDQSSQIGLLANAWLMKCAMELDAPDEVNTYYKSVTTAAKKEEKAGAPALRLVQYFHMQDIAPPRPDDLEAIGRNPKYAKLKPLDRIKAVQKEGAAWLKTYPAFAKTYEGQGVLYELALSYLIESQSEKDKKQSEAHLKIAMDHLKTLGDMDGDLSERARQIHMNLEFRAVGSQKNLKTFDQFLMKAMIDREKVREINAKLEQPMLTDTKKNLGEDRKGRLRDVIHSLDKALALANSRTPVGKVDEARSLLSGAYLAYGDPYRAAIIGESLARTRPPTQRSTEGAATALQTYSALQSQHPENVTVRRRLEDLAQYILSPELQRTWASDPVTSLAHYHLAMAAKRENKTREAIAHLEKLAPDFIDYIYTQGQIVFIAQDAREKADDKEKKVYVDAIKAAIRRMPKLQLKEESASVIAMYFYAKLELAKLLYSEAIEDLNARKELLAIKKCSDMKVYVKELGTEFELVKPGKVSGENHDQIAFTLAIMLKYADLGIAEVKFRGESKDRFDQVIEATKTVVNQMLDKAKSVAANQPIRLKDYRVTGDILGLALRANVQKGDVTQGKAILDVLKRLSGPKDDTDAAGNVVALLLNDIVGQIKRMAQEKDPAIVTTKKNYTAFLDEISKEYEAKGFDNNAAMMIGHAFISMDYPTKAASAFANVKAPASLDKKVDKKQSGKETDKEIEEKQKWEEELNRYWGVQVEYVRALRACKDDKEAPKKAEKVLATLLSHPNARFQVQAIMERNLLLEDQKEYRKAYSAWTTFLKMPSLKDRSNKDVQKVYFTGYFYLTRTLYKTAMFDPAIKDSRKLVIGAASTMIKLEYASTKDGWNIVAPMYQELLSAEPPLKEEYDKLKAAREKTTP